MWFIYLEIVDARVFVGCAWVPSSPPLQLIWSRWFQCICRTPLPGYLRMRAHPFWCVSSRRCVPSDVKYILHLRLNLLYIWWKYDLQWNLNDLTYICKMYSKWVTSLCLGLLSHIWKALKCLYYFNKHWSPFWKNYRIHNVSVKDWPLDGTDVIIFSYIFLFLVIVCASIVSSFLLIFSFL